MAGRAEMAAMPTILDFRLKRFHSIKFFHVKMFFPSGAIRYIKNISNFTKKKAASAKYQRSVNLSKDLSN